MNFRNLLARTVSSSLLGVDVIVSLPTGDVATRGTWLVTEEDAAFVAGEGIAGKSMLRTPMANLPSEPVKKTAVLVEGLVYEVDKVWERGGNYLIELKKVAVRP